MTSGRIKPTDGLVITEDIELEPGVYDLPTGLRIAHSGITIHGNGATLVGRDRQGSGITLEGCQEVVLHGLKIRDYYHGVYARDCRELVITGCQITSTAEPPANTLFLDVWLPADQSYGGGIFLWEVSDSQVVDNDLQHQMNGLLAYSCTRLQVLRNVVNYCSGYGFHLFHTTDSRYEHNSADFCCRYHAGEHGAGHLGADAAGFLILSGSSRNVFRGNFARMGGDGFFLAGGRGGCDDNLFETNDASSSPNIGFEATFSQGNAFRNNVANGCNYGFWLGFSRQSLIEGNQINQNRQAGIAVENGFGFQIRRNTFARNGHGILLWSKTIPDYAQVVPENMTSYNWQIEENTFLHNDKGIRIAANQDHGIRPLPVSGELGLAAPRPHHHTIVRNSFRENRVSIELENVEDTITDRNEFTGNLETDLRESG